MEIIVNLFRSLMFFFDNIIYGLIPTIYKLFIYLSELNLYSNEEGNPLYQLIQHIYVLLGIFMLFKVSFSLLQYIVDPNAFRDSSKGMGKLVTNVIVALVLLVAVPYIFNVASELQRIVVQENVIGQLILGTSASGTIKEEDIDENGNVTKVDTAKAEEMAKDLQFMLYGAFYNVSDSISACSETSGVLGSIDVARNDACLNFLNEGIAGEENAAANDVNLYSFFKHTPTEDDAGNEKCIDNVCDERDFSHFGSLLWWKDNGNYVIDYLPFISSAVGVYVVFLLISFSVDIAVRAIKLCFLQMLAPIAIVSYIDPKESISDGKLRRWVNESASTYFSLFLRLATIFFVMLLVEIISSSVLSNGGESYIGAQIDDPAYSIWIYLFLVIGAFMFAKQVPKMLDKIFKIENSGNLNLNPFKNEGFGALAGGTVGLGVGAAASGLAAFSASRDEGASLGTSFRRGVGGTLGGAARGLKTGVTSGGKQTFSKAMDVAGIAGRNAALKTNTTWTQRLGAHARQAVGMQSKKEGLDKRIGYHNDLAKHVSSMKDRATDQLSKKSDSWKWVQQERANLQEAVKNQRDISYVDKNGNTITASASNKAAYEQAYASEMSRLFGREQDMIRDYVNTGGYIKNGDKVVQKVGEDYRIAIDRDALVKEYNDNKLSYTDDNGNPLKSKVTGDVMVVDKNIQWDDLDVLGKAAEKEAARISNSETYQDAETIDKMQRSGIMQSHFGGKH